MNTKYATHACLHAYMPTPALNNDFNEQVLGRETKGTGQLISSDCSSKLDGEGGLCTLQPPHSVYFLSMSLATLIALAVNFRRTKSR